MSKTTRILGLAMVLSLLPAAAWAQSAVGRDVERALSGAMDSMEPSAVEKTPEEQAVDHFNQGVALVQRADKLLAKAAELEGAKREKLLNKVGKALDGAAQELTSATLKNAALVQAYQLLGIVQVRNERFDEAKQVYLDLAQKNREAATSLLQAMETWTAKAGNDDGAAEMTAWIRQVRTSS